MSSNLLNIGPYILWIATLSSIMNRGPLAYGRIMLQIHIATLMNSELPHINTYMKMQGVHVAKTYFNLSLCLPSLTFGTSAYLPGSSFGSLIIHNPSFFFSFFFVCVCDLFEFENYVRFRFTGKHLPKWSVATGTVQEDLPYYLTQMSATQTKICIC